MKASTLPAVFNITHGFGEEYCTCVPVPSMETQVEIIYWKWVLPAAHLQKKKKKTHYGKCVKMFSVHLIFDTTHSTEHHKCHSVLHTDYICPLVFFHLT